MTSKTDAPKTKVLADLLAVIILGIIFLLPFHAWFTTWAGSNFGHLDGFRIWKELLLVLLTLGCISLLATDKQLRRRFLGSKLVLGIGLYIVLGLLRTLYGYNKNLINTEAALYGMIGAWRYLVFFLVVGLVSAKSRILEKWWLFSVVTPATIVVLYGLLQQFVLDRNFLTHFGYGPNTIPAFQSVDQKITYTRAQSTLRGPNPLGAYLTMIVTFLVGLGYRFKNLRFSLGFLAVGALILMYFSYSRSAWIGLAISLGVWVLLVVKNKLLLRGLVVIGFMVGLMFMTTIYALRDNDYVQNTIFHTDENSLSESSTNTIRNQALKDGLGDIISNPLGEGLGTAGPASARTENPKISENYFIQVGQEVGVLGLVLYLSITAGVGYRLFERRQELLAQVLLASLIGITVINMVSHAWMDDTLSLMWWGLAGIALTPAIMKPRHEKQTKSEKKNAKLVK